MCVWHMVEANIGHTFGGRKGDDLENNKNEDNDNNNNNINYEFLPFTSNLLNMSRTSNQLQHRASLVRTSANHN